MSQVSILYFYALRKNCPYSEFFWSIFSRISTEYGDLPSKSSNSVQMPENTEQNNFFVLVHIMLQCYVVLFSVLCLKN